MTPAARIAAAIDLLDHIGDGVPAERALTNWGRANRYAGSGDRRAVRDLVFDVLRRRESCAALGGGRSGRALVLGLLRTQSVDPDSVFTGERHAPPALADFERAALSGDVPDGLAEADWPDWLVPQLRADLGADFLAISEAMQDRAPVILRVNSAKVAPASACASLAEEGVETRPHPLVDTALEVLAGAPRVAQSRAYRDGLVELQDAASQAAVALLPVVDGRPVLDFCAGGGGKALAIAARCPQASISAHDADTERMRDLPARAARAGAKIALRQPEDPGVGYDLVVVDAPCSGSGTWRRTPDAKWRLTPERLNDLTALQTQIVQAAARCVAPGGTLAYMTCSFLRAENEEQVARLSETGWTPVLQRRFGPLEGADGFFVSLLHRSA